MSRILLDGYGVLWRYAQTGGGDEGVIGSPSCCPTFESGLVPSGVGPSLGARPFVEAGLGLRLPLPLPAPVLPLPPPLSLDADSCAAPAARASATTSRSVLGTVAKCLLGGTGPRTPSVGPDGDLFPAEADIAATRARHSLSALRADLVEKRDDLGEVETARKEAIAGDTGAPGVGAGGGVAPVRCARVTGVTE
jgi:hypothetical protein